MNSFKKFIKIGILVLLAFVMVACGQDVPEETEEPSIEIDLNGHWTLREATVAGEPVIELAEEYEDELDIDLDNFTTEEEGNRELDVAFYYNEGLLTIVNHDGESIELDYEIVNRDVESRQMTLEYVLRDEDVEVYIEEVMTFSDDGERVTTETSIDEVEFTRDEADEPSEYEEELNDIGGKLVLEFIYGLDFELELEYVDDVRTPNEE